MRSGRVEKAAALAAKIGESIKNFNSVQLSRADVLSDPAVMWEKVRQLTGRSKNGCNTVSAPGITASTLNSYYAAVSTDTHYETPGIKSTANNAHVSSHITEWRVFCLLNGLKKTSAGLDKITAWFFENRSSVPGRTYCLPDEPLTIHTCNTRSVENSLHTTHSKDSSSTCPI